MEFSSEPQYQCGTNFPRPTPKIQKQPPKKQPSKEQLPQNKPFKKQPSEDKNYLSKPSQTQFKDDT